MFKTTLPNNLDTQQNIFQFCPRIYAAIDKNGKYIMKEYIFAGKYKTLKGVLSKKDRKVPFVWYLDKDKWIKKDILSIGEKFINGWSFSANYIQAAIDILNLSVEQWKDWAMHLNSFVLIFIIYRK